MKERKQPHDIFGQLGLRSRRFENILERSHEVGLQESFFRYFQDDCGFIRHGQNTFSRYRFEVMERGGINETLEVYESKAKEFAYRELNTCKPQDKRPSINGQFQYSPGGSFWETDVSPTRGVLKIGYTPTSVRFSVGMRDMDQVVCGYYNRYGQLLSLGFFNGDIAPVQEHMRTVAQNASTAKALVESLGQMTDLQDNRESEAIVFGEETPLVYTRMHRLKSGWVYDKNVTQGGMGFVIDERTVEKKKQFEGFTTPYYEDEYAVLREIRLWPGVEDQKRETCLVTSQGDMVRIQTIDPVTGEPVLDALIPLSVSVTKVGRRMQNRKADAGKGIVRLLPVSLVVPGLDFSFSTLPKVA